jgi:excisionase family DNA binding protein
LDDDRLLTVRQVAELLQVHPVTVQRWLRAGQLSGIRLPADKLGWRVRRSELDRFLAAGEIAAPSP